MREPQELSTPAARPVSTCEQDFLAWARTREHVLAASDDTQQLPHTVAEGILERALAATSTGPAKQADGGNGGTTVHSLAAARSKRRLLGGASMLALAAAASLLLVIRPGSNELGTTQGPTPVASLGDPIRFRLDVHDEPGSMRGDPDLPDEHRFTADDHLVLSLTPIERTRANVEIRVFAVQEGPRRALPWEVRLGDPMLGDRDILGRASDLGPGVWRLEIEAVDRHGGAVRWRGATVLRIQPSRGI